MRRQNYYSPSHFSFSPSRMEVLAYWNVTCVILPSRYLL